MTINILFFGTDATGAGGGGAGLDCAANLADQDSSLGFAG